MRLPLAIYDPNPVRNEYLSQMYFDSIVAYLNESGVNVTRICDLDGVRDSTILINGDFLTPDVIVRLKQGGNILISFDINDSSFLTGAYRFEQEALQIDLILKIAGIQKSNTNDDLAIDKDFNFTLKQRNFLPYDAWSTYSTMASRRTLQSLPYVPWVNPDVVPKPYAERSGKVLVKGGNHFYRFMVFLNLLKRGFADANSSFHTADYFGSTMRQDLKYCPECVDARSNNKNVSPYRVGGKPTDCQSQAKWGDEGFDLEDYTTANHWNNKCPRSFYWLAAQFEKRHGPLDHGLLETALNGAFQSQHDFLEGLSKATFYTDLKWWPSIYAPPRFWESAAAGTINFLPNRTNDQTFFPHIQEGYHYMTFLEDFTRFNPEISPSRYEEMAGHCMGLFKTWIQPGRYKISANLIRHILSEIEIVNG